MITPHLRRSSRKQTGTASDHALAAQQSLHDADVALAYEHWQEAAGHAWHAIIHALFTAEETSTGQRAPLPKAGGDIPTMMDILTDIAVRRFPDSITPEDLKAMAQAAEDSFTPDDEGTEFVIPKGTRLQQRAKDDVATAYRIVAISRHITAPAA